MSNNKIFITVLTFVKKKFFIILVINIKTKTMRNIHFDVKAMKMFNLSISNVSLLLEKIRTKQMLEFYVQLQNIHSLHCQKHKMSTLFLYLIDYKHRRNKTTF
jgi:hypothetical protein